MGFKMKGASLHQGTDGHKKAIEAKKAENRANQGEGFMHPPYKKQVGPTEKRSGYHGYKNFKSNLDSKQEKAEDARGVDTNIKTPKVFKDGPKNRVHGVKNPGNWQPHQFRSPNKMHAKGHKGKKTHEDYLDEGFSQVEADQMMETGATTGKYTPKKKAAKKVSKKKAKKKKIDRPQPTWEGTDEYRKPQDIPAEEYKKRGLKKPSPTKQKWLNRAPEGFDWKGAKAKAKEAFKRDAAKTGHGTIKDVQAKVSKKPAGTLGRTAKTFQNVPKQFSKGAVGRDGSGAAVSGPGADAVQKSGEIYGKDKIKKKVKKAAKKIIKKPGRALKTAGKILRGGARVLGPASIGLMAYDAYKSGQKHSGGKIDPNQKQVIKEGKKKSGGSIMAQGKKRAGSIYDKN